jgi:uracil phosphoribosyltransferase
MLVVVEHPLCACDVRTVRDRHTDAATFRQAMHRIGLHVSLAALQHLPVRSVAVETPLEQTTGAMLDRHVVAVPILRAGLMFLDAFLTVLPNAAVGYVGLRRNEETLEPEQYYWRMPELDEQSSVVVLDPMLATGGSASAAIEQIASRGVRDITLACAIAAPEGIERIMHNYPEVRIVAAALDRQLNEHGFILPGLGDAGDRAFGTDNRYRS